MPLFFIVHGWIFSGQSSYNLPRLTYELEDLSRLINSKEIEETIKNLPQKKSPVQDVFTSKVYQTFKDDLLPVLLKLIQKIEEAVFPHTFYEANKTLIPALARITHGKETTGQHL